MIKFKNSIINDMISGILKRLFRKSPLLLILVAAYSLPAFTQVASPSNWLYPDGNLNATLRNPVASSPQLIDSFSIKWTTPFISGDVKPLIGNIVVNNPLLNFLYEPNEIAAVMGDEIILISGTGSLIKKSKFPDYVTGIKSISTLVDTNSTSVNDVIYGPVLMGLEGIEQFNPLGTDSLAYSYLFGFNSLLDSITPLKRLAINLRQFNPNIYASIKPIYGLRVGNRLMVYATVNMTLPKVPDPFALEPPYFRGLTQFYDISNVSSFPLPDIKDDINNRAFVGPEVNLGQPSIFSRNSTTGCVLLPSYPTTPDVDPVFSSLLISSLLDNTYLESYADVAAVFGINFANANSSIAFTPYEILPDDGFRPLVKPYYVDITDANTGTRGFILVTEQYNGIDGSQGLSKVHLHDIDGNPLTDYDLTSEFNPGFKGDTNHYWSVAVGNVDGNATNEWAPYYPNNPGNEIILTQTSRDFVYPGSRLFILKYFTGPEIEKPSPNGEYLFTLDTICSHRINGWVAAINDLDNSGDGKDEIILADGNKLMIIRLRDYNDYRFRLGYPFDTLYTREFFNQAISSVAVADLEGDGLNDIVVTTDDSTYVIGSVIPNTLTIINPSKNNPAMVDYCVADTVAVKWINTIYSQDKVNLFFIYDSLGSIDTLQIKNDIPNNADTVTYSVRIDSLLAGLTGRFAVVGTSKPQLLSDYSGSIHFNLPNIQVSSVYLDKPIYKPFDDLIVNGSSLCADSIYLEIKADSTTWLYLASDSLITDNTFSISTQLPCLPDYFACNLPKSDTTIDIRLIAVTGEFSDTTSGLLIKLEPLSFPIIIDTTQKADPTIYFSWNKLQLDTSLTSNELSVSVSLDEGRSYQQIISAAISDEKTYWNVPVNIPDSVIFRFCVPGTCIRKDTLLGGIKPTYIDIIAPNPFNPDREQLQIVYQVPEDTRVTIKILDQNNRMISEVINSIDRSKGFVYSDYWNGIRQDGATAAIGMYYVLIELSNGKKEVYPVYVRK